MIKLENVSYKINGRLLIDSISLDLSRGSCWVITGKNGSGKSLLAMLMHGEITPSSGTVKRNGRIGYASFELQQAVMAEERKKDSSVYMHGGTDPGTSAGDFLAQAGCGSKEVYEKYISVFSLEKILHRGLRFLSTGEFRKLLLCRAMLAMPDILIVDDPFDGLDRESKENFKNIIASLIQAGEQIVIATGRAEDILPETTHAVLLENGKVKSVLEKRDFPRLAGMLCEEMLCKESSAGASGAFSADLKINSAAANTSGNAGEGEIIVEMKNISVAYEGIGILENINWTVRRGERWKITGPNGSGKSTLMSLITGDNPKGYSPGLSLFGRKRGSGESVWDIKKRIGFVSGDFQMNYRVRATLLDVVLSGFFDSIGLYDDASGLQQKEAHAWLAAAGLAGKEGNLFRELSYGEKRMGLIIRAAVKNPDLLILDEPCQGLDSHNREKVMNLIEFASLNKNLTILYVTHESDENLKVVFNRLELRPHKSGQGYTAAADKLSV